MAFLSDDRMHEAILSLYDTGPDAAGWGTSMRLMAEMVSAERITLLVADPKRDIIQESWPVAPDGADAYARDYAPRDLRFHRIIGERRRGVFFTEDLMSPEEIARCPVHNEFYRDWPECQHALMAAVEVDGQFCVPSFHRSSRRGQFDDETKRAVGILSRHISKAAKLKGMLSARGLDAFGFEAAFDGLPEAIFILDNSACVVFANAQARRLLRERHRHDRRRKCDPRGQFDNLDLAYAFGKWRCRSPLRSNYPIGEAGMVASNAECNQPTQGAESLLSIASAFPTMRSTINGSAQFCLELRLNLAEIMQPASNLCDRSGTDGLRIPAGCAGNCS